MRKLIIPILVLLLVAPFIVAEQATQQSNKILLSPYYRESMNPIPYSYTVTINPPDKISSVQSAIITFSVWHNPTISYALTVNGQSCNPSSFLVHTSFENAGNNEISFDCSSIMTTAGDYTIVLTPDDNTGSITAWMDVTYINRPRGGVEVHGTEYAGGENGTVFLQLTDDNNNPISDGFCSLTIYYPDTNKTKFYDSIPMTYLENGLYYRDLFIPEDEGVYMINVFCSYSEIQAEFKLPSEDIIYDGSLDTDSTDDPLNVKDTDCVFVKTATGQYHEFRFDYPEIGNLNLSLVTSLDLLWVGQHQIAGSLEIWNFSDSSWYAVGSTFTSTGDDECWHSQAVIRTVDNFNDDYRSGDEVRFRFKIPYSRWFNTDEATLLFHQNGSVINDIRGSGEIHVGGVGAGNTTLVAQDVWNYTDRQLTEFNFDVVNETEIAETVWSWNGFVSGNLLDYFAGAVWNWTGSIAIEITDAISDAVWKAPDRNLTYYPTTNITINNTEIAQEVWNATARYTHGVTLS